MKHAETLLVLFIAAALSVSGGVAARISGSGADVDFIRTSCRRSNYPSVCTRTLTTYAAAVKCRPRNLASVAVYVSQRFATLSSSFLHGHPAVRSSRGALRDCIETVDSSVDLLRQSAAELRRMGRRGTPDFSWRRSNVQTWVSAAMSDQSTCIDGVVRAPVDHKVKAAILGRISRLRQRTSVALFLINRL